MEVSSIQTQTEGERVSEISEVEAVEEAQVEESREEIRQILEEVWDRQGSQDREMEASLIMSAEKQKLELIVEFAGEQLVQDMKNLASHTVIHIDLFLAHMLETDCSSWNLQACSRYVNAKPLQKVKVGKFSQLAYGPFDLPIRVDGSYFQVDAYVTLHGARRVRSSEVEIVSLDATSFVMTRRD